ncbi:MAG: vitamin K epoxide reductase family protein [Imperialibacter sp.]|uniref:vitamin K epoxide reductase family protein n=1 Tax=Imperialibacter sp. TaxID=2038411 RepID=UPI0032ED3553
MDDFLYQFMKRLNIPVSQRYLKTLLQSHEAYPSLLSIADTFQRLGLNYHIQRVARESLNTISFPYLLPLERSGGDIIAIENERDLEEKADELVSWNGVVIEIEPAGVVSDPQNKSELGRERLAKVASIVVLSSVGALITVLLINSFSFFGAAWLATCFAGAALGYLLFAKELGIKYQAIEAFCNAGVNTNCDKVLESGGAKFLGTLRLSDLTFSFFLFQALLFTLFSAFDEVRGEILSLLFIASMVAIPATVYSLYYQYFRMKTWCRLCLLTGLVLILQSILFTGSFFASEVIIAELKFGSMLCLGTLFVAFAFGVVLLSERLIDANEDFEKALSAGRVKNSAGVFMHLLFQQKHLAINSGEYEILIGNPDAEIRVTMASNLFCNPCKEQHKFVQEVVSTYSDKVSVAFRFVKSSKTLDGIVSANEYLIQYWLTNIFNSPRESDLTELMLKDWYDLMDINKFSDQYPLSQEIGQATYDVEKSHADWILASEIRRTPTFFVNGYELPQNYKIKDLTGLIPSLVESLYTQQFPGSKEVVT